MDKKDYDKNSDTISYGLENLKSKNPNKQGVSRDFIANNSQNRAENEPFYFLNIFKPCGITSFDVIYKLRKILKIKKIGHSGTLDPLADGVMQVGVGKATRLLDYLGSDKKYVAKIRFGYLSSTCDAEGDIAFFNIPKFTKDELLAALKSLNGQIEQIPPAYSAVKVGGKKLCDLARQKNKKVKNDKNEGFENSVKQDEILPVPELQTNKTCLNSYIALNEAVQKDKSSIKSGNLDIFSVLPKEDHEKKCDSLENKTENFINESKNTEDKNNSLLRNINENLLDFEVPKRIVTIYETKLLSFVTPQEISQEILQAAPQETSQETPQEMFEKIQRETRQEISKNPPEKIEENLQKNIFEAEIEITCSKGTYIRSFAVDLAQKLGTGAYLTGLKRIQAGNFEIKDSVQIEDVNPETDAINPCAALDLPKYELNEDEYRKVLNGVSFVAREKQVNREMQEGSQEQENCIMQEKQHDVKKLHNDINFLKPLPCQQFMLIFQNNLVSIAVLSDNNFVCKKVFK